MCARKPEEAEWFHPNTTTRDGFWFLLNFLSFCYLQWQPIPIPHILQLQFILYIWFTFSLVFHSFSFQNDLQYFILILLTPWYQFMMFFTIRIWSILSMWSNHTNLYPLLNRTMPSYQTIWLNSWFIIILQKISTFRNGSYIFLRTFLSNILNFSFENP